MSMDFSNAQLPALLPLERSFAENDIESDLKRLFIDLFSSTLGSDTFDVNVLGAAHMGSFDLVRRAINRDGLVLLPGAHEEAATRYLYRAWKSANVQGRGLHFLRTYLQVLFPEANAVAQMLQDKSKPYPSSLIPYDGIEVPEDKFLTSRIQIDIDAGTDAASQIGAIAPIISSSLPARITPYFRLTAGSFSELAIAGGFCGALRLAARGTLGAVGDLILSSAGLSSAGLGGGLTMLSSFGVARSDSAASSSSQTNTAGIFSGTELFISSSTIH